MNVDVRVRRELNDFLSLDRRSRALTVQVAAGTTVKDLAESLGVPHTEIDVIVVNGESVDFDRQLSDGDRVGVYPTGCAVEVTPIIRLYPPPLHEARFVLDVHLGRLARYLRLLGFDVVWRNAATDAELAGISHAEERILLTREVGLLKRSVVTHGYFVRETAPRRQVVEVLRRFNLVAAIDPFGRCLDCNGLLESAAKAVVEHRLPPRIRRDFEAFQQCRGCGRVYWQGSHYDRMCALVDAIRLESNGTPVHESHASLADAALAACNRGWSVVPTHTAVAGRCSCGDPSCAAPGKHPRVAWEGFTHRRATRDEIGRWWRRWPQANVGVITGAVSGLVVLDVDPRHGGGDALAELEAVHGALPRTLESLTGGGGQHLYFRHPHARVPSRTVVPGLDLKSEGGIVISPPSRHITGRAYAWEAQCAPGDVALAEMPSWLLRIALKPPEPSVGAHRTAGQVPSRTDAERGAFAALWAEVGVLLGSGDRNYLCPFHNDHHPSLHVDAEGCRWYCFGCARGGGVGRLRRLVATHLGVQRPEACGSGAVAVSDGAATDARAITLTGPTVIDVVGESRYQDSLLELTGGRRHYAGGHMSTVARLVPERDNAVDPEAIVVTIAGRPVGYLSRADAARLGEAIASTIQRCGEARCAATIVGGWEREHGDVGYFGVRVRL